MDSIIQNNNISEDKRPKTSENNPSRHDLATRERVNFVVNSTLMGQLRDHSKDSDLPMSRIIDMALSSYLNTCEKSSLGNSRKIIGKSSSNDIILHHLLELIIEEDVSSASCLNLMEEIKLYFSNFIYTSCLLRNPSARSSTLGTKIYLFLRDQDSVNLSNLLKHITKYRTLFPIKILLDSEILPE